MKERGRPLIIALRLRVVNGQITEIEHVLARTLREDALRNLARPRPEFTADVAPAERLPRERMVAIADSYFEAIEHADGKLAPFADDCVRRENGGRPPTTPPRCRGRCRSARRQPTMPWLISARSAAATSSTPT
jgi:hypothetical protein